ncbi:MAG: hypothetical protein IT497_03710 [Ottowia sp.]|nr:hypothetical protein [Ottowia sp.]
MDISQRGLIFGAGPSGSTGTLLQSARLFGKVEGELLSQYVLAIVGYLVGGGMHSYHEVMSVAHLLGCPYEIGNYKKGLPQSFLGSEQYTEWYSHYHDIIAFGAKSWSIHDGLPQAKTLALERVKAFAIHWKEVVARRHIERQVNTSSIQEHERSQASDRENITSVLMPKISPPSPQINIEENTKSIEPQNSTQKNRRERLKLAKAAHQPLSSIGTSNTQSIMPYQSNALDTQTGIQTMLNNPALHDTLAQQAQLTIASTTHAHNDSSTFAQRINTFVNRNGHPDIPRSIAASNHRQTRAVHNREISAFSAFGQTPAATHASSSIQPTNRQAAIQPGQQMPAIQWK